MRRKGISYDTGLVSKGRNARQSFDPAVVRRELEIIRDDLHCNAVRVMGGDPRRLELAATYAAELGLEVWFSPYPLELTTEELLALFADCAERAQRLRRRGAEVVFVTGAELSLMKRGFLPGDTLDERLRLLHQPQRLRELLPEVTARVNGFLAEAVALVRQRFGGRVTYAAVPLERVDWARFDLVSLDLYRSAEVADRFGDGVFVYDKDTGAPVRLDGELVRDEEGQARYLRELLEVFEAGGVDSAFVFTFALHGSSTAPAATPARTSTWPATASSRSSRTAAARPTPTWPGSPRPRSGCWPGTTAADGCGPCGPWPSPGRRRAWRSTGACRRPACPWPGRARP